jgi:hypothetical protein
MSFFTYARIASSTASTVPPVPVHSNKALLFMCRSSGKRSYGRSLKDADPPDDLVTSTMACPYTA